MSSLPYRPNICMLVLNSANDIFIAERISQPDHWQFPQGGIEEEFSEIENVFRELEEELGADRKLFTILFKLKHNNIYDYRSIKVGEKAAYRGQSQLFYAVKFIGTDQDITLTSPHAPREFSAWKWAKLSQAISLIEQVRQQGHLTAIEELKVQLNSRGLTWR